MTLAILARAFWLTYRSLRYRDTVLTATPARSATVAMFGFRFIRGISVGGYQEPPKPSLPRLDQPSGWLIQPEPKNPRILKPPGRSTTSHTVDGEGQRRRHEQQHRCCNTARFHDAANRAPELGIQ